MGIIGRMLTCDGQSLTVFGKPNIINGQPADQTDFLIQLFDSNDEQSR